MPLALPPINMRTIKNECWNSGNTVVLSSDEQFKAQTRCSACSRILKLRKNQGGFAAQYAVLPRHKGAR